MKKVIDKLFVVATFLIVALSFIFANGLPCDPTKKSEQK